MKKIVLSILILSFIFSTVSYAYVENVVEPTPDYLKKVSSVKSIGDAAETVIAKTEDAAWQIINKLSASGRSVMAVADRGLEFLKSFFQPRIHQQGYEVDEWVNTYISIENNNYVLSTNAINMFSEFADYCFHGVQNEPVTYKAIDIFGKNLKFSDNGAYVNMEYVYEVCRRYQDNYYIGLYLTGNNVYENTHYFQVVRQSSSYDDTVPAIILEPKTYGYLVPNAFSTISNYFYGLYSQSGNGGGSAGVEYFEQFRVNSNYELLNAGGASSSPPRLMYKLRIMKSGDKMLQFTDPFKNSGLEQVIPIVYQKDEVIELYNNGFPAPNPNAHVKHTTVNVQNPYRNEIPVSDVENLPTTQDMQNYENFRDAINGDNNTITNEEIINYITNIYPNGDDYTTDPNGPSSGGGLIDSLVNALGGLGTLIGSILSGLLSAIVNALTLVVRSFQDIVALMTDLIPDNFRSFMELFYGLIPEPIMNGFVALFSLACVLAVIRIIRK